MLVDKIFSRFAFFCCCRNPLFFQQQQRTVPGVAFWRLRLVGVVDWLWRNLQADQQKLDLG
jgi:hypothetical protein